VASSRNMASARSLSNAICGTDVVCVVYADQEVASSRVLERVLQASLSVCAYCSVFACPRRWLVFVCIVSVSMHSCL